MLFRVVGGVLVGLVAVGCCKSKDSGASTVGDPAAAGGEDLSAADVRAYKGRLNCADKVESYYCSALDRFVAGDFPASLPPAFYPGLSIYANLLKEPRAVTEEAAYLTLLEKRAEYDSIIPENDEEKRQVARYLDYFHRGTVPPAADPTVKFCHTLSTAKAVATRRAGKSLLLERPLDKPGQANRIYVRQAPDAMIVLEVGPAIAAGKLFFVGVFPKSLQIKTGQ